MTDIKTIQFRNGAFKINAGDVSINFTSQDNKDSIFNHTIEAQDFIVDTGTQKLSVKDFILSGGGGGGGGGTNGKYSQWGQVEIKSENTGAYSILTADQHVGSTSFSSSELLAGTSYHVKFAGTVYTDSKEKVEFSAFLGTDKIYTTTIDTTDYEFENLGQTYVYEVEFDFVVGDTTAGLTQIYTNGQLLYVKGVSQNNIRGMSSEYISNIDLTTGDKALDIKFEWVDAPDTSDIILNKMVRVTKMY